MKLREYLNEGEVNEGLFSSLFSGSNEKVFETIITKIQKADHTDHDGKAAEISKDIELLLHKIRGTKPERTMIGEIIRELMDKYGMKYNILFKSTGIIARHNTLYPVGMKL